MLNAADDAIVQAFGSILSRSYDDFKLEEMDDVPEVRIEPWNNFIFSLLLLDLQERYRGPDYPSLKISWYLVPTEECVECYEDSPDISHEYKQIFGSDTESQPLHSCQVYRTNHWERPTHCHSHYNARIRKIRLL